MILREPTRRDAPVLFTTICTPEVCEYLPPPPSDVRGLEVTLSQSVRWRRHGRGFAFVIHPAGACGPVGLIQFLARVPSSGAAPLWEWGFALGAEHWRTGIFGESARLALDFALNTVRLPAVEAWVVRANSRANRAMEKLDARGDFSPGPVAPDGRHGEFVKWTLTRIRPSV